MASTEEVLQFIARDRPGLPERPAQPELQHLSGHCPEDLGADPQMEELFITHNLSPEDLALLHQQGDRLTALMDEIRARSPEVSCEE